MNFIVQLIIAVVLNVAATIIQRNQQQSSAAPQQSEPGVSGTSRTGEGPATFIIGKYATPGQLVYPLSCWTSSETDATPNEYLVGVYGVSMLPVRGLDGVFVNGQECTLLTGEEETTIGLGYPVEEYRDSDDVDHLWVKFYDGTQESADSYLRDKFGSHPDRPWRSTAVGAGVAYVIVTARANREFFPAFPKYKFVLDGIELNDTRGDDEQENNIVAARTIMSGLYYDGAWFYGPQDVHANMLPTAQWEPEMDKCDESVNRKGGGSDKRYRCGMEITVTEQSIDIINELLKGCAGRITYASCQYKVLVGAPGSSVNSITEADVIVDHTQELDQFPGMQEIHNGVRGEYICPEEAWNYKDAPVRVDSDYVDADDGRELFHNVRYRSVWDNRQAQRLMKLALKDGRKFRRHVITVGPEFFGYEPLDVIDVTFTREGYDAKEFLITAKEDLPNGLCVIGLHEVDATDYDWEPDDDEDDFTFTVTSQSRPPAQTMTGWTAQPGYLKDANGNNWRPSIEVGYTGGLRDVRSVRIQARVAATEAGVFDGVVEYDPTESSPSVVLQGQFTPDTLYEVRGRFRPFGKRRTNWSSWLEVTTPDIRINTIDFSDGLQENLTFLRDTADDHIDKLQSLGETQTDILEDITDLYTKKVDAGALNTYARKSWVEEQNFAKTETVNQLSAVLDETNASALLVMKSVAKKVGSWSRVAMYVRVDAEEDVRSSDAAFYLESKAGKESRVVVIADKFIVAKSRGNGNPQPVFAVSGGKTHINEAVIPRLSADKVISKETITGNLIAEGEITAKHLTANSIDVGILKTDSVHQSFSARLTGNKNYKWKDDSFLYRILHTNNSYRDKPRYIVRTKWSSYGAQHVIVSATFHYAVLPAPDNDNSESYHRFVEFGISEDKKKASRRSVIAVDGFKIFGQRQPNPTRFMEFYSKTVTVVHQTNYGDVDRRNRRRTRWLAYYRTTKTGPVGGLLFILGCDITVAAYHLKTKANESAEFFGISDQSE